MRPRIGLALSGGAVRGGAHVGVLKVLDANGLEPDCIAGTSVGAIIGSAYAAGLSPARLERLILTQTWPKLVRPSRHLKTAMFDIAPGARLLREVVGLDTFADLHIPFVAVGCDISNGEAVALRSGDLVEAVLASASVPGLFAARERDGRLLVDGGIVNNLPVDVLREMGADIVIAVDLLAMPAAGFSTRPANLFEIWQRSLNILIEKNHPAPELADHTISPRIAELSFTDFDDIEQFIRRGEEAALRDLPRLRQLVLPPDPQRPATSCPPSSSA